ncbi:hypothetical protein DXG01_015335 [Tephrocybe rancida]|nr:hypothetical protein DXG01_015335 [Tephrocybe rancida]
MSCQSSAVVIGYERVACRHCPPSHVLENIIVFLELEAVKENTIMTGWLDSLISNKLTAERPDATLVVVCGAVTKAYLASDACQTEYKCVVDKGQVPAKDVLKTVFGINFIYENVRYSFTATRSSSTIWMLYLNGGRTMVSAHPLADGGLLVLLDRKSHLIYWHEEVGTLRERPSPGKLIRFFVDSGDHINAGEQYAEIEVMKMYMPLVASEGSVVQLIKQPGVSLEPGNILGILTLDDPARVKYAKPFEGQLLAMGGPGVVGNKPHQRYVRCMGILNDILDGFDNQAVIASTLKDLINVLHEPKFPYTESGHMPIKLEQSVRHVIDAARAKDDNVKFPAVRIKKVVKHYIKDNVLPQDRAMLRSSTSKAAFTRPCKIWLLLKRIHILGQMPSYEEHLIQMESVLKNSISNNYYGKQGQEGPRTPSVEVLKELGDSRYTVYNVLPAFFNHEDPMVTLAAFEVYICCTCQAYTLLSIDYEEGDTLDDGEAPSIVTWCFNLRQSHSPPSTPCMSFGQNRCSGSISDLTYMINRHQSQPVQTGTIASFPNIDALSCGFERVVLMLPTFDNDKFCQCYGPGSQPPNIVNVALYIFHDEDDMSEVSWTATITKFVNDQKEVLTRCSVCCVSVLICHLGQYPVYYTLHDFGGTWGKEQAIHSIKPALAFQLELSRLSNYNLMPCFIEAKQIHIYLAITRENQLDNRFFIRALVCPGRLRGMMSNAEYLISKTDCLITSVLGALEVIGAQHRSADCNHIFMNFVYNLASNIRRRPRSHIQIH